MHWALVIFLFTSGETFDPAATFPTEEKCLSEGAPLVDTLPGAIGICVRRVDA